MLFGSQWRRSHRFPLQPGLAGRQGFIEAVQGRMEGRPPEALGVTGLGGLADRDRREDD